MREKRLLTISKEGLKRKVCARVCPKIAVSVSDLKEIENYNSWASCSWTRGFWRNSCGKYACRACEGLEKWQTETASRFTTQTSVRASHSIGLEIDRAISIPWKKGGRLSKSATRPGLWIFQNWIRRWTYSRSEACRNARISSSVAAT